MRLIDVDKLKEYIDDCKCCEKCDKIGFMCNDDCELPDCVTPQWERVLNEQPTVDAQPVRHGRWIGYPECLKYENALDDSDIVCSVCGEVFDIRDNDTERFAHCPHCGAIMDTEKEEANERK